MKQKIRAFFGRSAETVRATPVESLLTLLMTVYGLIMVAGEFSDGEASVMLLYPFAFTLAYVLNRLLPKKPLRWVYLLSPLLIVPFLWCELKEWVDEPSFWTALGLCPALLLLFRWRRDNATMVVDGIRYVVDGAFAYAISGIAFLLLLGIYHSLRYIFPEVPWGDEDKMMGYFAVLLFLGVMPLLFLTLDRMPREGHKPVRIIDILVNYVLTPALLIYTVILYAYFIRIALSWSLPKGGIAYMVFAFTMIAVAVKAYLPLTGKRFLGWFYDNFQLISLPALAMFWIGVLRRIGDYGLTTSRIYLLICGAVMTFTVLMFLVPLLAKYRYPVLGGALLFSLAAFFPGITASRIALCSQYGRFEALAGRYGILDSEGKIIIEKLPAATDEQQADYNAMDEAFDYISDNEGQKLTEQRYGISNSSTLREEVLPDNVDYENKRYGYDDNTTYLYSYNSHRSIDLNSYSTMEALKSYRPDEDDEASHYYVVTDDSITIYSPANEELMRRSLQRIFETQVRKAGLDPAENHTEEVLREAFPKMLFYEDTNYGILIESMNVKIGSTTTPTGMEVSELFIKK